MDFMMDLLPLAGLMLASGLVGGVLAGLLGIGGGIVIVPVLEVALGILGVDPQIRMHIAVATSLATIIPTSVSSARAHHARGAVDIDLVKRWAIPVLVGSLVGTYVASQVESAVLSAVFAVVALVIAVKMILPLDRYTLAKSVPDGAAITLVPFGIGTISAMMGIGGGTISVSALTLMNQPVHRAIGTASLLGLCIAIPGTIGFMFAGAGDVRLPYGSIGYVNLVGFALIACGTYVAAPWGARIAHAMSQRWLSLFFGLFLLTAATRMFYRAFAG